MHLHFLLVFRSSTVPECFATLPRVIGKVSVCRVYKCLYKYAVVRIVLTFSAKHVECIVCQYPMNLPLEYQCSSPF